MTQTVGTVAQAGAVSALIVGALSLLGLLIRQIGPWKRQAAIVEDQLRAAMAMRIDKLEGRLERQEARHRAEMTMGNHQFRNISASFDAMLLLLEMNPDRGPEIVVKIKEMRAAQMLAEAEEKAILNAALLRCDTEFDTGSLGIAAGAVSDAKQTLRSTNATKEEIEREEASK